jgi:hypothetical protein
VRLLVAGEASRVRAKVNYPLHPKRNQEIGEMYWADMPKRALGPHDGIPDLLRDKIAKGEMKKVAAPKMAKPTAKPKPKAKGKK